MASASRFTLPLSYLNFPPENKKAEKLAVDGPDIKQIGKMFEGRSMEQIEEERKRGFFLNERIEPTIFVLDEKFGFTWQKTERKKLEKARFGKRN